jgi:hypothetical protein
MALSISKFLQASPLSRSGRWMQAGYLLRKALGLVKTPEASPQAPATRSGTAEIVPANDAAFASSPQPQLDLERKPLSEPISPAPIQLKTTLETLELADVPLIEAPAPAARAPVIKPSSLPARRMPTGCTSRPWPMAAPLLRPCRFSSCCTAASRMPPTSRRARP